MKPTAVSADALFEDHRASLQWQWLAGQGASERRFDEVAVREATSGADLVGYLNYIHPYRLQILGGRELAHITADTPEDTARRISRILTLEPPALIPVSYTHLTLPVSYTHLTLPTNREV